MNTDFARRRMVEQQVRTWDVGDARVLATLDTLSRNQFVRPMYADLAYADTEIPLSCGQCMLRPIVEGRIQQLLKLTPNDTVLEVGSGSGYLTACLASLAGTVISVELFDELIAIAEKNLGLAEIGNDRQIDIIFETDIMALINAPQIDPFRF